VPEVRVNDVTLYFEEHGTGEPILCIHGTGSSSALWVEAAAELATRGRTILYDRRGFSRSERPEPFDRRRRGELVQERRRVVALLAYVGDYPRPSRRSSPPTARRSSPRSGAASSTWPSSSSARSPSGR
jgi:pimeloyl-ACP methyl ester carboxylesterase